jgi:hypothetical protein
MRILVVISIVALSLSSPGLAEDATCAQLVGRLPAFVEERIALRECGWPRAFFLDALAVGLSRVCAVNPHLARRIIEERLDPRLSVACDVVSTASEPAYPYFDRLLSTIHVWSDVPASPRLQAALFHEFLHSAKLPTDPDHDSPELTNEKAARDPVYACHVTGYPEVAERVLGDIGLFPVAVETCRRLVLNGP